MFGRGWSVVGRTNLAQLGEEVKFEVSGTTVKE